MAQNLFWGNRLETVRVWKTQQPPWERDGTHGVANRDVHGARFRLFAKRVASLRASRDVSGLATLTTTDMSISRTTAHRQMAKGLKRPWPFDWSFTGCSLLSEFSGLLLPCVLAMPRLGFEASSIVIM